MEKSRGFTLIEVLAVISILALLGAGTITALRSIRRSALRQQAAVETAEIAQAALQYRSIYGIWPNEDCAEIISSTALIAGLPQEADAVNGIKNWDIDIREIIPTLQADSDTEIERNPRGIVFLELPQKCFIKEIRREKHGDGKDKDVIIKSVAPLDPWGRPYVLVMARSKRNAGKVSRTVSHIEGGVYAVVTNSTETFEVDSPEDAVAFSWGDPLAPTGTNRNARVIGSWRTE